MRHFPLRELGHATGFIVLLTALYVGAYYATVERSSLRLCKLPDQNVPLCFPWYPMIESDTTCSIFSPMHELDLRFRPDYWDGK
jgi:hypothetical protein